MSLIFFYIFFLFAISVRVIECVTKSDAKKPFLGSIMGSYIMEILSVDDCDLAKSAYNPTIKTTYHVQPYRVSRRSQRLKGNFTLNKEFENMAGELDVKYWANNGYANIYELRNVSCNYFLMAAISKMIKLTVSPKCTVAAGEYSFDNLDVNGLWHTMVSIFRYGQYSIEMKWINSDGVILCIKVILVSKPDGFKE